MSGILGRYAALALITAVVVGGCSEGRGAAGDGADMVAERGESPRAPDDPIAALDAAMREIAACPATPAAAEAACGGVVYVWSPLMPLSGLGIEEIESAAAELDVPLSLVPASSLYEPRAQDEPLAQAMVAAGATLHYPAILVHRDGELVGPSILGYKTAATYRGMIAERLASDVSAETFGRTGQVQAVEFASAGSAPAVWRDLPAVGRPGPYFRWVAGRNSVAYEAARTIHLLDLASGANAVGPGWIDFVPTPDGRLFVMPDENRRGLHFYDAREVYAGAAAGRGTEVEPVFMDPELRDQYPSVGLLETSESGEGATSIAYRVLTSWYDGVVFRDYAVAWSGAGGVPSIRPTGRRTPACSEVQLSIPILSRDGRTVAGRDEATGTTKLFRLADDGSCEEVLDTELPTGKVAFGPESRRIAFAIPRGVIRDGTGRSYRGAGAEGGQELAGIFVLDREGRGMSRVHGSEEVERLAFPDFIGPDSVVFLMSGEADGESRFRVAPVLR